MSRALFINMIPSDVIKKCLASKVGVSAIEALPSGGTRLVCMSSEGAIQMSRQLKQHLMDGTVKRERHRPINPHW